MTKNKGRGKQLANRGADILARVAKAIEIQEMKELLSP
ncbi:hypothetical protein H4W30_007532 [Amycolatopsis roodepoortensis]|uniref:Uncharacterized protein n=1 Tax=Amycolatopsis roodepoortensis TaxID=700274 RepID=A0ABR9LK45_9PSEU|nr:hypothetical protein [Amycolatopsis roodepoortensis]